ncbi:hypothetical protein TSUD_363500 [Trifolium subterraneum]|uniref:Protein DETOXIFICATION n=1 Tax=Trifolium subterraneum TaxID=3900 RepID=A0A2Z6MWA1_TRISU|nr:hypothetical protein TSUD_363500 [Trifolium subterraneum]
MNENGNANELNKKWKFPFLVFFSDARLIFKLDALSKEILGIALPSALAVAADPIASLIDTAFIGHLGAVELAAAGVSIALFNQASKITIFPLVSITTSFVAEEDTIKRMNAAEIDKTKLRLAEVTPKDDDLLQDIEKGTPKENIKAPNGTVARSCGHDEDDKKHADKTNGGSPMLKPAMKYLIYRSFGAPAVLLSLAMQGIFRGFKDTTTPLYVIRGLLMTKVIAVTFCVTLAASLAARLGPIPMAAFQPCLQIWLAASLFADGLAIAVQAILAGSFAEKDYNRTTAAATRTLQFGFILGLGLSLIVGVGLYFGAGIFSKNAQVIHYIRVAVPS